MDGVGIKLSLNRVQSEAQTLIKMQEMKRCEPNEKTYTRSEA